MGPQLFEEYRRADRAWRLQIDTNATSRTPKRAATELRPSRTPRQSFHRGVALSKHERRRRQDNFADGMVDDIITALAVQMVVLIARNSSLRSKAKPSISRSWTQAWACATSRGCAARRREKVRIAGQLIDAVTGAHIWRQVRA